MNQQPTKHPYVKPAMQVIVLRQQPSLLQASKRGPYDPIDDNPFLNP